MYVKNINGTSDTTCRCGSWLAHWQRFSGQRAIYCGAVSCSKTDLVGAHVQKGASSTDAKWHIYPLCAGHNQHQGELQAADGYQLVSANKSETCGG